MGHNYLEKVKLALIFRLARRLSNCKTVTPMLSRSLDRNRSFRERMAARFHLVFCEACRLYLDQIRFLSSAMTLHDERLTDDRKNRWCERGSI